MKLLFGDLQFKSSSAVVLNYDIWRLLWDRLMKNEDKSVAYIESLPSKISDFRILYEGPFIT